MNDERSQFEAAIEDLRFGDARRLVASAPESERAAMTERLRGAIDAATEDAERFANRIQALAREDHYAALYALAKDPLTQRRLALLPDELRRGATVHLNGAQRRRELSLRSARGQLATAREALDSFLTGNARKALARVDETWLEDSDMEELAVLRERLDFVKAEADELAALAEQALAEHEQNRRSGIGRGCLSSILLLLALVAALAAGQAV